MANNQYYDANLPPAIKKLLSNWRAVLAAIILLIILATGLFQVGPEEVGVITRFGKYTRTVQPGLNFKIPFAEQVKKVPVERQQKLEFGFRTTKAAVRTEYTRAGTRDEALMLTGDLNLADVEWVVQYRIDNAYNYLFTGLLLIPFAPHLFSSEFWSGIGIPAWTGLLYMVIFPTTIGYTMFYIGVIRKGPAWASTFIYLVPSITANLDYLFFKVTLTTSMVAGTTMVVFGLLIGNLGKKQLEWMLKKTGIR